VKGGERDASACIRRHQAFAACAERGTHVRPRPIWHITEHARGSRSLSNASGCASVKRRMLKLKANVESSLCYSNMLIIGTFNTNCDTVSLHHPTAGRSQNPVERCVMRTTPKPRSLQSLVCPYRLVCHI